MSLLPLTTEIFRDKYDFCRAWIHGFQRYSLFFLSSTTCSAFGCGSHTANVGSLCIVVKVAIST